MPITPYTTPIQFEYKPLNLAAFAVPLAQMQEKFDVTQALVNESDVDLAHTSLGTDPIKAEELKKVYREKRDELAKNLIESGNYTQAATKLKELNRLWQTDPEKKALESNYALRQNYLKEQKERIDSGKKDAITRDQYYQDIARKDREYKGGQGTYWQHDPNLQEGQYNLYGTKGRLADLEKDLEEMSWKVANAVEGDKRAGALREIGIDPMLMDKKFAQTVVEERDANKVAKAVQGYLKTLPRFRDWALEKADYDYDELKATNPNGFIKKSNELTNNALSSINEQIAYIQKESKKKGQQGLLQSDDYKRLLAYKDELQQAKETGEIDEPLIRGLYDQEALNKMYDMTALGKVFEYKNIDTDYTFRDIPTQGSGSGGGTGQDPLDIPGGFAETTYDPINLNSLKKQRYDNVNAMLGGVKNTNDIGGGIVRTFIQGQKDTDHRKKMEKDIAGQRGRQEQLFQIAARIAKEGGSASDLHKALWNAGFKSGNTPENAKKLYNSLLGNNGNTLQYMQEQLNSNKNYYDNWSDAKSQEDQINKRIIDIPEFKQYVGEVGQEQYVPVSKEQFAELKKLGLIDKDETFSKSGSGRNHDYMKYGTYNKERGVWEYDYTQMVPADIYVRLLKDSNGNRVKNLQDAFNKGIDLSKIKTNTIWNRSQGYALKDLPSLSDIVQNKKQEIVNSKLKGEFMSTRYVGDAKMDKFLNAQFLTADDFTDFQPATTPGWKNVKGFDEEGKLLPGTQLLLTDKQAVKIVKKGNKMLLEIPYKYDNEDQGKGTTSVLVDFKKASRPKQEAIVNHILYLTRGKDDSYSKQTYQTAKSMQFDMMTNSNINDRNIGAVEIKRGDAPVVLQTVDGGDDFPGINLQIVKEYVEGRPPIISVRSITKDGKRVEYLTKNGKKYSTSDLDAAKVFAGQVLYGE